MNLQNNIYTHFNAFYLEIALRKQLELQTSYEVCSSICNADNPLVQMYNNIGGQIHNDAIYIHIYEPNKSNIH